MDFNEFGTAVPSGPELSSLRSKLVHYFFPDKSLDDPSLSTNLFPAMTPVTLCRRDFQFLRRSKYWVIEKSDGDRCLLLSLNEGTYLIDTAMKFYRVDRNRFYLPKREDLSQSQHETLLDGIMVYNHSSQMMCFMASDAVLAESIRVAELTLSERIAAIRDQVVGPFRRLYPPGKEASLPFLLLGKEYWPFEKIKFIIDKINHVEDDEGHRFIYESGKRFNENDGMLFIPDERPYRPGRNLQVKKWKWLECNTVRFIIKLSEEFRFDGKPPRVVCKAYLLGQKGEELEYREIFFPRKDIECLEAEIGIGNRGLVECYYDYGRSYEWRVRTMIHMDMPPSKFTYVLRIMESNSDKITKEDLLHLATRLPASQSGAGQVSKRIGNSTRSSLVSTEPSQSERTEDLTSEENHPSPPDQPSKRPLEVYLHSNEDSTTISRETKRQRQS